MALYDNGLPRRDRDTPGPLRRFMRRLRPTDKLYVRIGQHLQEVESWRWRKGQLEVQPGATIDLQNQIEDGNNAH